MELVVATPFYSFFGIYVEPQWGTETGASLGLVRDPWYIDVFDDGLTVKYRFSENGMKNMEFDIVLSPALELRMENTLIYW